MPHYFPVCKVSVQQGGRRLRPVLARSSIWPGVAGLCRKLLRRHLQLCQAQSTADLAHTTHGMLAVLAIIPCSECGFAASFLGRESE